jgi:DNA-binding transcriptional ArsR family regulator
MAGAADGEGLADETIYSVLTNPRRRYVLHYLKQRGESVSVRDLAEQVAAWENGKEPEDLTSQERKRVYVSLYQSHLSTLDDEGVVEYDDDAGEVRLSAAARGSEIYMEVVPKNDIAWQRFYVGLVVVNAVLLALVALDVRPFTAISDLGWAAAVLAQFAVSAVAEALSSRRMQFGDEGPPPDSSEV